MNAEKRSWSLAVAGFQIAVLVASSVSLRTLPAPAPGDPACASVPPKPGAPPGVPRRVKGRLRAMPPASAAATLQAVKSPEVRPDLQLLVPEAPLRLSRTEACPEFTKPDSLRIFLFGSSHNHRAPPA